MPFIPGVHLAKVAVEGAWLSQAVVQTFWFTFTGGTEPAQADLEALAAHMATNWNASMRTSQASNYYLTRVTATRQTSNTDIQGQYIPTAPIQGTGGASSVPLNVNWCFTYRTLLRGRNWRGRGYQPGFIDSIRTDPGHGNLTILLGIAGNYVNWLITTPPTNWVWVVASHYLNKVPRATASTEAVQGVTVDDKIDSQRRRLIGRGQ